MRSRVFSSLVFITASVAGCASQQTASGPVSTLEVEVSQVVPMNESLDASAVEVFLQLYNPTDGDLTIEAVRFTMDTGDVAGVIKGSVESGAVIEAGQQAELKFKQKVPFPEEPSAYQAVLERKEIPITLQGEVELDNGDEVPFERATSVATPTLPQMVINDVQAARYGRQGVDVTMFLRLVNENMFSVLVEGATYTVTIAGKEIRTEQAAVGVRLVAGSAQEFSVSAVLDEEKFEGAWLKQVLEEGKVGYTVKGTVELRNLSIPFEYSGEIQLAAGE